MEKIEQEKIMNRTQELIAAFRSVNPLPKSRNDLPLYLDSQLAYVNYNLAKEGFCL